MLCFMLNIWCNDSFKDYEKYFPLQRKFLIKNFYTPLQNYFLLFRNLFTALSILSIIDKAVNKFRQPPINYTRLINFTFAIKSNPPDKPVVSLSDTHFMDKLTEVLKRFNSVANLKFTNNFSFPFTKSVISLTHKIGIYGISWNNCDLSRVDQAWFPSIKRISEYKNYFKKQQ